MKYDDPKLRALLAGRYVLGVMPHRARARFDRLIARDAAFGTETRDWAERFAPLDRAAAPEAPPPRVWRAIEARIDAAPRVPAPVAVSWLDSLWLWRSAAGVATAVAAALLIYLGVAGPPGAPMQNVVAVLMDKNGAPAWIARTGTSHDAVTVAALGRQTIDAQHSFELWAIAGGAPRPLGLLSPQPDAGLVIASAAVPPTGGVLAISLEPAGGSPSGAPTGPVLFQGKVLLHPL